MNARGGNVREADVSDAFRQAVNRITELRPDLVLVAGDVFHTVRPSNTAAQSLYTRFGFRKVAVRRGYYPARSGREDALVLTLAL